MNITKVPFARPSIGKKEINTVKKVLKSGWLTTGKETELFEKEMEVFTSSPFCFAVNSNTSGLFLCLKAMGVNENNRIITSPYTFTATAAVARHLGSEVVFCDVEPDSYNISPENIKKILKTEKDIKTIVPVHFGGLPCKMEEIRETASKQGLYTLEDSAHAFPAKTEKGFAGTLGDCGVYSFYTTKTLCTGEGGMILTKNPGLAEKIRILRSNGIDRQVWDRYTNPGSSWFYDVVEPGYKMNLPDILSAMGRVQLKRAFELLDKRKKIAEKYFSAFKDYDFIIPPPGMDFISVRQADSRIENSLHIYPLRLNLGKLKINRDEFANELQNLGIGISVHFIPLFLMTYWKQRYSLKPEDFPNSLDRYLTTISLPIWPDMTKQMVKRVIDAVTITGKKYYKIQG